MKKDILSKIVVKETSRNYKVFDDKDYIIGAEVDSDTGAVSLSNQDGDKEFCFVKSDPEVVEAVAKLMLAIVRKKK